MGRRKRKSEQVIKELWQAKGPSVEPSCLYQLIAFIDTRTSRGYSSGQPSGISPASRAA